MTSLGLGTAQFGMAYGVSNRGCVTPESEVRAILEAALAAGVAFLDTAPAYGEAEAVIGRCLAADAPIQIVTKTEVVGKGGVSAVVDTFRRSLRNLKRERVYGLLTHRADDLLGDDGDALWSLMAGLRACGAVDKIGVSVYGAAEIDAALERFDIDLVQVPLNILDQRLIADGRLGALARRGVEIHARSAFLQGLLLMAPEDAGPYFDSVRTHLAWVRRNLAVAGYDPLRAALAFVADREEVAATIVGVTSATELHGVVDAFWAPRLEFDFSICAWDDEAILNPSRWP